MKMLSQQIDMLTSFLFFLCAVSTTYFIYQIIIIDAQPYLQWKVIRYTCEHIDYQEALLFLISGLLALAFLTIFGFFAFKFLYNVLFDRILSQFNSLLKPIILLALIAFSFSYIHEIKTAVLTGYTQITVLVNIAKSYDSDKHPSIIKLKSISGSFDDENKEE